MKGTTKSGFEFEIQPEKLNDYELLELIAEVDGNPLLLPKLVNRLLGEDQKKKLLDHVRTEDGRAPIEKVSAEVTDIFTATKQLKNS